MGYYINPPDMTKEQFLSKHGKIVSTDHELLRHRTVFDTEYLPVVLVDNGYFMAAGIAFSKEELSVFMHPDGRPKTWYIVPREALVPYYANALKDAKKE